MVKLSATLLQDAPHQALSIANTCAGGCSIYAPLSPCTHQKIAQCYDVSEETPVTSRWCSRSSHAPMAGTGAGSRILLPTPPSPPHVPRKCFAPVWRRDAVHRLPPQCLNHRRAYPFRRLLLQVHTKIEAHHASLTDESPTQMDAEKSLAFTQKIPIMRLHFRRVAQLVRAPP